MRSDYHLKCGVWHREKQEEENKGPHFSILNIHLPYHKPLILLAPTIQFSLQ